MSFLAYALGPDGVSVWTDTLVVLPGDERKQLEERRLLTSKAYVVPHLRLILAGTGMQNLIAAHAMRLLVTGARNVDELAVSTPDELRRQAEDFDFAAAPPGAQRTTLYHFGWSTATKGFIGYAYRSTSEFKAEALPRECRAVKPAPEPETLERWPTFWKAPEPMWAEIARAQELAKPKDKRVFVGGELQAFSIYRDTTTGRIEYHVATSWHRFSDFAELAGDALEPEPPACREVGAALAPLLEALDAPDTGQAAAPVEGPAEA